MAKITLKAAGKEILLRWDLEAWVALEEEGYSLDRVIAETKSETPHRAWLQFMTVMANSGARHCGEKPEYTAEWLVKHLTPSDMRAGRSLCMMAYMAGNRRENAEDDDDVDEVLAELKKKRESRQEPETV